MRRGPTNDFPVDSCFITYNQLLAAFRYSKISSAPNIQLYCLSNCTKPVPPVRFGLYATFRIFTLVCALGLLALKSPPTTCLFSPVTAICISCPSCVCSTGMFPLHLTMVCFPLAGYRDDVTNVGFPCVFPRKQSLWRFLTMYAGYICPEISNRK